ncbi:MAG: hypothetical protein AB9866_08115 [Syntrophobacteraceae bacterium]
MSNSPGPVLLPILMYYGCGGSKESTPLSRGGVLDPTLWDPGKEGIVRLDGEWELCRYLWNLNPGFTFGGNFNIPDDVLHSPMPVKARVELTLLDIYGRPRDLLPGLYVHRLDDSDWYFEPSEEEFEVGAIQ